MDKHLSLALDGQKTSYVEELISEETERVLRLNFEKSSPAHALARSVP